MGRRQGHRRRACGESERPARGALAPSRQRARAAVAALARRGRLPAAHRGSASVRRAGTRPDFIYDDAYRRRLHRRPAPRLSRAPGARRRRRAGHATSRVVGAALPSRRRLGAKVVAAPRRLRRRAGDEHSRSGSLVRARGREWVVLPDSDDELLVLRPLGGAEAEVAGAPHRASSRSSRPPSTCPDPEDRGDDRSAPRFCATRCASGSARAPGRSARFGATQRSSRAPTSWCPLSWRCARTQPGCSSPTTSASARQLGPCWSRPSCSPRAR